MSDDAPKCYLVTEGEYSDYSVVAVFLTRDEAERYVEDYKKTMRHPSCLNDIDEMPLGRPTDKVLVSVYHARINFLTGEMMPLHGWVSPATHAWAKPGQRSDAIQVKPRDVEITRTSYVSQEHAEKLCVESRQEWLRLKATAEAKT